MGTRISCTYVAIKERSWNYLYVLVQKETNRHREGTTYKGAAMLELGFSCTTYRRNR